MSIVPVRLHPGWLSLVSRSDDAATVGTDLEERSDTAAAHGRGDNAPEPFEAAQSGEPSWIATVGELRRSLETTMEKIEALALEHQVWARHATTRDADQGNHECLAGGYSRSAKQEEPRVEKATSHDRECWSGPLGGDGVEHHVPLSPNDRQAAAPKEDPRLSAHPSEGHSLRTGQADGSSDDTLGHLIADRSEGTTLECEAEESHSPLPEATDEPKGTNRPAIRLLAVTSVSEMGVDQSGMDETVFVHEGSDLYAEDIAEELAVIPEPEVSLDEPVKRDDVQVGDADVNTKDEIAKMKDIIWEKRHLLIGKGNALPPPAKGAVCDIDVQGAKPVAQRVRKLPPEILEKLFQLLKGLLGSGIIEVSESPWASPIVVILKKNGVDIRLCIDYRVVNGMTKMMVYPMPLVNDLLENMDAMLWFCSLDMASGFWVARMTERAKKVPAFVTPFGLFQWTRMAFGLKNAPQLPTPD